MHSHKRYWVDIAMSCKECSEVLILAVRLIIVIKLHHIEIFFSIEELILVIRQECPMHRAIAVPLWEMMG